MLVTFLFFSTYKDQQNRKILALYFASRDLSVLCEYRKVCFTCFKQSLSKVLTERTNERTHSCARSIRCGPTVANLTYNRGCGGGVAWVKILREDRGEDSTGYSLVLSPLQPHYLTPVVSEPQWKSLWFDIFVKVSLSNLWKKGLTGFFRSDSITGTNLLELLI